MNVKRVSSAASARLGPRDEHVHISVGAIAHVLGEFDFFAEVVFVAERAAAVEKHPQRRGKNRSGRHADDCVTCSAATQRDHRIERRGATRR